MKTLRVGGCLSRLLLLLAFATSWSAARAQSQDEIRLSQIVLTVEVSSDGGNTWAPARTNQLLRAGDRVRTGPNSRATILIPPHSAYPFPELTQVQILPATGPSSAPGLHILRGLLSIFHRGQPNRVKTVFPAGVAGIKGTEFLAAVDAQGRTTLHVIDGEIQFTNAHGTLTLTNGQFALLDANTIPRAAAPLQTNLVQWANNLLQWAFYYPAILDPDELPLTADETAALRESLAAYRAGDLPGAITTYPARPPATDAEKIYRAALLLSVGNVEESRALLAQVQQANPPERTRRLAAALRLQIATTKREPAQPPGAPQLTTELLAASYFEQNRADSSALPRALHLAQRAATNSPQFGFTWVRMAELQFSFGHTEKSHTALQKGLALSPRHAQAHALRGFLHAAQNNLRPALDAFDRALALDPSLANAWLGRGLSHIRRGDLAAGRADLLLATALEPRRATLRSYLGKSLADTGERARALHELDLARELDPADPTPWLYSALIKAEHHRLNEAIDDLETSQQLNDNRSVYRSSEMLDQDEAMRRANLARLYADADLVDVGIREAGRALANDYANYSAHLFLANSYELERRANLSNFRYEAPAFNEYLLANLLGPANGGLLAQSVSQLEYSSLFDRNRIGLFASTEYFERGAWHHSSAQYGTLNNTSYSLEAEYRSEPGERTNQDLEIRQLEAKFKHDLTANDSLYLHFIDYRSEGGDNSQQFDHRDVAPRFRFDQRQTPDFIGGYRHRWSPQNHTLILGSYLNDILETQDPLSTVLAADRSVGTVIGIAPVGAEFISRSRVELYGAEAQQIAVFGRHSLILGLRGQWSEQQLDNQVRDPFGQYFFLLGIENPISVQDVDLHSFTAAGYAYDYLRVLDSLQLVGGVNYTYQTTPSNIRTPPVTDDRDHQDLLSPKAGFLWSPVPWMNARGSYTRSLTGFGPGQSVRLEPSHVAGLLQSFRDPAPSSLVGPLDGAELETFETVWEGRFRDTFVAIGGQRLTAERSRRLGLFVATDPDLLARPSLSLIRERVDFRENALELSTHQLLGDEWSFGARYRLGYARLRRSFPDYPGLGLSLDDRTDWRGWLHTLNLSALYRHHSGIFVRTEGVMYSQDREQEGKSVKADDFWQANFLAGYRFPRQKAEVAVGVLNAFDSDYRLDPINRHADQPRARTFYARLLLNF